MSEQNAPLGTQVEAQALCAGWRDKGAEMSVLLEILQEMHDDVDFSTHETLIDDSVIDSFDIITLIAEIDDRIGVTIPAEELVPENFNSYAAINALIDRLKDED